MKKKILLIALILVIFAGVFIFKKQNTNNPNNLTLYGNIDIRTVDLSFQVSGKLQKLLKEEGDTVKAGEVVAIMDDRDYSADYEKAEAELNRTSALLDDANSKYKRNEPLVKKGAISKQDFDTILNTKKRMEAEYSAAVANKKAAKNRLEYTKIYAPEDGIIMTRAQENGATLAKGQIVYTMAKINPVWVRAYVNEKDLGNIKYGQKALVYTDTQDPQTGKKREYEGTIGYISPVAEFTPKTVQSTDTRVDLVYRIRVYIYNTDEFLRQGMPVTINVNLKSDDEK